ncbi:16S rRNA (guanine(966)-N(2))-methyltransferase RsmD [Neisseriaceae bacterium B1]
MKKHSKHQNQVRITGGALRGRKISFADVQGLRPTPEMVREKLFNWLGQDLTEQTVLDLFSGSGVLSFEALSRHAKQVVMCENQRATANQIMQHVRLLDVATRAQVIHQDGLVYLRDTAERFDLVLLDPPFAWQDWTVLFASLQKHLNDDAFVYIEAGRLPEMPAWLQIHRKGKAGQSQFALLRYMAHE